MKKSVLCVILSLVLCIGLCLGLTACKKDEPEEPANTTVKQVVYTGSVEFSESEVIPVQLILDDFGTFSLVSTNGVGLPIGFWGMRKAGVGGVYRQSGSNVTFKTLVGEDIATATTTTSSITIDYQGFEFTLTKSEKTVETDELYGSYKGYLDDDFEVRLILRGDNNWVLVEEDGDVSEFGKYKLTGNSFTGYYNARPTEICAYGTVNGNTLSLNVEGDNISFQKVVA